MKPVPKILAVDDIPENLLLLCDFLEDKGYIVRLASDGELVLRNIETSPPDLILLDIRLSGMSGYEVCFQLKANPETKDIPIIFLSIYDEPKVKVKAFQVGGSDYITKPFQEEEVVARIENQLTIRRQRKELEDLQDQLLNRNQILKEQNNHLELLLRLTQIMNTAPTIDSAIAQVLTQLCQVINWDYGEAWVLNVKGTSLQKNHCWYAKHPQFNQLHDQIEEAVINSQRELVEMVAQSQKIEWIDKIEHLNRLNFEQRPIALNQKLQEIGITSLLAIPIVFNQESLAVLLLFSKGEDISVSSANWLHLIESVASQLGTLMQRLRTEIALKQANEKLQHLVAYDGLTEIANRRRFDEYLDEQWRQGKRERKELSLILCDLDAFKLYNDYWGHQAGDKCLQKVAQVLEEVVKRPMDLVARYGGEELAVLLPDTFQVGALQVAEKIRQEVKALKLSHPQSPVSNYVTISVGVSSIIPRDDCSPKTLIRMADQALYQAKKMGRDRVILNNQSTEDCMNYSQAAFD